MVLFKEAKKKNEIRKAAEMACQKKEKEKEPEKRDIHVDLREQKEQDRAPPPASCPVHSCPGHLVAAGRMSLRTLRCCARSHVGVGR